VTSATHLYKKLDEFGKEYDQQVKEMVEKDTKWIVEKAVLERETEPRSAVATCAEPSPGFKLTIDNVDYHQNVHYMTEDHQNIDRHYVTVNATINRISGTHLSADKPVHGLKDMENVFPISWTKYHRERITSPWLREFLLRTSPALNLEKML
jgi:hypothetical protein